ncbi:MAG: GNAT family N-acetyltransferase [Deltaproteobacteria bacterium]|nr:GNAT family N-acetyltransferase [Deltaproteobacteria bacterium]MBN2845514.1 GNAT family N-acetyltransferase [Deltaproteobacteria bacterium]
MKDYNVASWESRIVTPEKIIKKLKPGMKIFLGTGAAEPRTLIKHIIESDDTNLRDLEFIQLLSLGDALPVDKEHSYKYRLKTFFSGWLASEAIEAGRIDFIPSYFSKIPLLVSAGIIEVDVAFVQITPPDKNGFCSLGVAVDMARRAMERASLVVGEINNDTPFTMGDTFLHVNDFDYLVRSTEKPIYFPRLPAADVHERLASNIASVIEDGSCISFSIGPLFEALLKYLAHKKDLGVHSLMMTDALMDLIKSGAVTNKNKRIFRNKSVTSYAQGTQELFEWLDRNPLIEFQGIEVVTNPRVIGENEKFIKILPARKVDLSGGIALQFGKGNVTLDPNEVQEIYSGVELSKGGRSIFALPSRNLKGESNIVLSVKDFPGQLTNMESLDLIVTEFGLASLRGRTMRERALALIDIAHPDDRNDLVQRAKKSNILYPDQIYMAESGHLYPDDVANTHTFRNNITIRFRAIKPSDEDDMRRLFYRFSDKSIYYRYFSPIKMMPHMKMQEYVNVDYKRVMSIVGLIEEAGAERVIAEGRYTRYKDTPHADVAFVVDETLQGTGVGTYLFEKLIRIAKKRGIEGFKADIIADNKPMLRIFEKSAYRTHAFVQRGVYELTMPFTEEEGSLPQKKK